MAKKNYETGKVITKHLNVREKPDGMVRDLLHLGDCVVVVSKRGEWFKVKGDTVSVRDVFCAFSASYVRALMTVSCAAVLFSLALAVPILTVRGTITLHAAVLSIPHTAPYAVTLFVPYAILILFSLFLMLCVSMPAYLLISIRIHAPSISLLRAAVQSVSYLKRDLRYYLKMRGQLLLLDLCSVFSVCALFPIYTIPLQLLANALYAARLSEKYGNAVSNERKTELLHYNRDCIRVSQAAFRQHL